MCIKLYSIVVLKISAVFLVDQSFRNIIYIYHWLLHWKCTVNLTCPTKLEFTRSFAKVGRKMTCYFEQWYHNTIPANKEEYETD